MLFHNMRSSAASQAIVLVFKTVVSQCHGFENCDIHTSLKTLATDRVKLDLPHQHVVYILLEKIIPNRHCTFQKSY
jgi:hypothetical protein